MKLLLRITSLALVVVIAAGLLAVPASAAPQPGVAGASPTALLSGGGGRLSPLGFFCPNTNIGVSQALVRGVAKRAKVSNDQAVNWLCAGIAPREIVLARQISKRAGVSMDQVFTLRNQGMGWNAIAGFYDVRDLPGNYFFDTRLSNNPFRNVRNGVIVRGRNGVLVRGRNGVMVRGGGLWRYNRALGVWVRVDR